MAAQRPVDDGVGLVVEIQGGAGEAVGAAAPGQAALGPLPLVFAEAGLALLVEVAGPFGQGVAEVIGAEPAGQGGEMDLVLEHLVAVGAVGVLGQGPDVVEGDRAPAELGVRARQQDQLAGGLGPDAGGGAGDAGVVPQPRRGVPERADADRPAPLHLVQQVGLLGLQAGPSGLQEPGLGRELVLGHGTERVDQLVVPLVTRIEHTFYSTPSG